MADHDTHDHTGVPGVGGTTDLDAILAVSGGQDIADALTGAAAPDSGNVFATMADVGGGGADLVQTNSGAGNVYVPGLRGSADALPTSPNGADDEFEALSGWTTLGTLDVLNVSDFPSNVHMKRTNVAVHGDGIYKACPTIPFTVTCKLTDMNLFVNYNHAGVMIGEASPGKFWVWGPSYVTNPGNLTLNKWTTVSSLAGATNYSVMFGNYFYLRMVVNSSSSVDLYFSLNGLIWSLSAAAVNPGFTVGSVGLAIDDSSAAGTVDAAFDWIRFA